METAVSWESPVIILMETPEPMSVATASLTPDLGGSMMPTRPRKVRFPSSGPEANASTAGRADVSARWRAQAGSGPGFTSEAGAAHVADLLLVELPLLVGEGQHTASAVVGGAQTDHLLVRPLQEVDSRVVLSHMTPVS